MTTAGIWKYWAKASREQPDSLEHLPLVHHLLDVGGAADALLNDAEQPLIGWSRATGIPRDVLSPWMTFLAAIHDLGKIAYSFQGYKPHLMRHLGNTPTTRKFDYHHSTLGLALWNEHVVDSILHGMLLGPGWQVADSESRGRLREVLGIFGALTFGHHGRPVTADELPSLAELYSESELNDAGEIVRTLAAIHLRGDVALPAALATCRLQGLKAVSWSMAGFIVLADWIGSNEDEFGLSHEKGSVPDVGVQRSKLAAAKAVNSYGLRPVRARAGLGFTDLFDIAEPRPMQHVAYAVDVSDPRQLVIIEDMTGSGKTEAALSLVHRFLSAGHVGGAYLGLPTQATANGIFNRVRGTLDKMVAEGPNPNIILAHSKASEHPLMKAVPSDIIGDDVPTSAICSQWIRDRRKAALLAHVGVGTVDQALMGALPIKHQSLRLFGLGSKVLVVDEVHAYDEYMMAILKKLIRLQAALGLPVVLMTATLPLDQRAKLMGAYRQGAGWPKTSPEPLSHDFPCLARVTAAGAEVIPVEASSERRVRVHYEPDVEAVVRLIAAASREGACVAWVRNTVDDAVEGWRMVQGAIGDRAVLFHARFTVADRQHIEDKVLDDFGPDSTHEQRAGRVVVATQVIEQSLDLDFDLMITDLAPIDLVIQRAGRLQRHARERPTSRISGVTGQDCAAPLVVHGPTPTPDADQDWFKSFFPRAHAIYPDHGRLWLTAHELLARGGWTFPADARELIEAVYKPAYIEDVPAGLRNASGKAAGEAYAEGTFGREVSLDVRHAYGQQNRIWHDDRDPTTRLGGRRTVLQLARWDGSSLTPIDASWSASEVVVPSSWINDAEELDEDVRRAIEECDHAPPAWMPWCRIIAVRDDGERFVANLEGVTLVYDRLMGLQRADGGTDA